MVGVYLRRALAVFGLSLAALWTRSYLPSKRKRQGKRDASQQSETDDGIVVDGSSTTRILEAILKEYKARNSKTDRQRKQDQTAQEKVACWTAAYTVITGVILVFTVWQSFSARGQLDAALTSNRAWISIDPRISTPMIFDSIGAHFDLAVTLKNVGHSPATEISAVATAGVLFFGRVYEPERVLRNACRRAEEDPISRVTLFPDETFTREFTIRISLSDIRKGTIEESRDLPAGIIPILYVCTTYIDAASGVNGKKTGFVYSVGLKTNYSWRLMAIPLGNSEINPGSLGLRRDFATAGFAE